jgi:hypothetical protein
LDDLSLFLRQFEHATGLSMQVTKTRERPDFEVVREADTFGLELVKVVGSPQRKYRVLDGEPTLSDSDASDLVQMAIYDKEVKRASPGWGFPHKTILVVQLFGALARDVYRYWDETIRAEVNATGFIEIWLSDHSPVEPHGTVEIVGVKTKCRNGMHRHSMFGSKPYG